MIGATLDKYEVLQKVGEGGMATVYRGRHATLDRSVAIKVLHPHLSSSTRNRKRFAREARAIEHLRHDNILEIFDYSGLDASECYIITEFVEGDTVTALLRSQGRLASEAVSIIGLRLARALDYAHREGILHRDLKPDNVMIRVDGTVKLMDFGIARFLDESQVTMTGALVGSPAFMSPEQAKESALDHRSDLFSLGTMLYYLVSGTLPFTGSNTSVILKNVIESNRPSVSEVVPTVSATLADVIERLMAPNPDDRFNTAGEVVTALEAVLAESNVDPDEDRWSLKAYIDDPDAWEDRLHEHLLQVLLLRGRERLAAGDHLSALRLFNRLLALDEDNAEVLELVRGLHDEPESRVGGRSLLVVALALSILGAVGFVWAYQARVARESQDGSPATTLAVPTPGPAPAQTPRPSPAPAAVPDDPKPAPAPVPVPAPAPAPEPGSRVVSAPRPTAPPEPEPGAIIEEDGLLLVTSSGQLYGKIFVDDSFRGYTREGEPIPVDPGVHVVQVRGPLIETWEAEITVSPGERTSVVADLAPKPAPVNIDESCSDACSVVIDDQGVGTVGSIGRTVMFNRPDLPHVVRIECPDQEPIERRFSHIEPAKAPVLSCSS